VLVSDLERIEAFLALLAVAVADLRARAVRPPDRRPDPRRTLVPEVHPQVERPPPEDEADVLAAWATYARERPRYILACALGVRNGRTPPQIPYRLPVRWVTPRR